MNSLPMQARLACLFTVGIGLVFYLAIFVQSCLMAWKNADELQRLGLVMFVLLFMLSITTNSMVIDMEEGHFTMLISLAPKSLDLTGASLKAKNIEGP